jgi:quercetin dioxygenase-like cupin family protein
MLRRAREARIQAYPWGQLEWLFSGEPDGPRRLSIASMLLRAGQQTALHRHRNCEEVLQLVSGRIEQRVGDAPPCILEPGDAVFVPAGVPHASRAIGDQDARIRLSYSAAEREYEEVHEREP